MNKNQLFEFNSKYVWPLLRPFLAQSTRCSRCILSDRHGELVDGLCAECREFRSVDTGQLEATEATRSRFDETIKSHIREEGYDALLLLSGGKDSAFILKRMRDDYPQLKILCVTVNNGFMSPFAIQSATHAAQKLKCDLVISNRHIDEFARVLRQAFLDLDGRGSYGVVDFADGSLIFEVGQRMAMELGIPMVIGGLSWVQVQRIVGNDEFLLQRPGAPAIIFPLAVWRVSESDIRATVRDDALLLPGSESPIVSNSSLVLTMSALDVMNLGYCSFEPEFAQLVREGKADRKTWLHLFELMEYATVKGYLDKEIAGTLEKLDLEINQVRKEKSK